MHFILFLLVFIFVSNLFFVVLVNNSSTALYSSNYDL